MRWPLVVPLVVVLAVAGCSGALGPSTTPSRTLTPASVPEGPGTSGTVAPGVGDETVVDADLLAAAHETTLDATSYRFTRTRTVTGPNGTLLFIERNATVAPERRAYTFTKLETASRSWAASAGYSRIDIWYHGNVVRNRFRNADGFSRFWGVNRSVAGGPIRNPTGSERAATLLAAVEFEVANRTENGSRLVATDVREPGAIGTSPLVGEPRNVTLTATVDARGVVRAYALTYRAPYDGRTVTVTERQTVTRLGAATVPQPAWLPDANASMVRSGGPS